MPKSTPLNPVIHGKIERAGYTFQMQPHPETFLNLDWKMMGAGGIGLGMSRLK